MVILFAMALVGTAWAGEDKEVQSPLRLELDLADGTHIIGIASIESIPVQTSYAKLDIALKQILTIKIDADHENASIDLRNGDKLKGVISLEPIKLETIFGRISVGIEHIKMVRVVSGGGTLPAGDGPIAFGGVNWIPLRKMFEVQGDKLVSLPQARPGFNYGHGGNGRGPWIMTNIDSAKWKNYSAEFDFCMLGEEGGTIMFHVADFKESWNESGWSSYNLGIGSDGSWGLSCMYNAYCRVPVGYGDMRADSERSLATGKGLKIDQKNGNRFRIDVRGTSIKVWADGVQIVDMQDDKMGESIGGKTLDHGGVGFYWTHDSMGWIRNFSAKAL